MRRACSSKLPWEKLTRTRSTPAAIRSAIAGAGSVAGPSVATILVRLAIGLPFRGAPLERGDGGQGLAFHELEEGATARRNIGDLALDTVFLDRCEGVAAARDRERRAL